MQVVGQWEEKHKLQDDQRLTWWYPDFGIYVKNELVSDAWLIGRYEKIAEKLRVGHESSSPKFIAEQLKEGAAQVGKDNPVLPAPKKKTEKER